MSDRDELEEMLTIEFGFKKDDLVFHKLVRMLNRYIDQVSTRRAAEAVCAELKQIVDWDVPATYEQNGKTWQGLAIPRNLVRKRLSQLQPTKGSK